MEIIKCGYVEKMDPFSSRLATLLDLAKNRFFLKPRNNTILIHFLVMDSSFFFSAFLFAANFVSSYTCFLQKFLLKCK